MRKGFTLIELMVVVLIVAVLAAVIVPLMTARVEAAKWSEAKAALGTIGTALRAYVIEHDYDSTIVVTGAGGSGGTLDILFKPGELSGKYFANTLYSITSCSYNTTTGVIEFDVEVTKPATGNWRISKITLDETGTFTETES